MSFEYMVAGRHLRGIHRQRRSYFTAGVATAGVGLGVAALAIVLSVMNGYAEMIWSRVVGMNAHVTIRKAYGQQIEGYGGMVEELASHTDVVGVSPYIESEGFVQHRSEGGLLVKAGVMVRGADEAGLAATSDLACIRPGSVSAATGRAVNCRASVCGVSIAMSCEGAASAAGAPSSSATFVEVAIFTTGASASGRSGARASGRT